MQTEFAARVRARVQTGTAAVISFDNEKCMCYHDTDTVLTGKGFSNLPCDSGGYGAQAIANSAIAGSAGAPNILKECRKK